MSGDPHDTLITRVEPFFDALFTRDASGRSWLSTLLAATPDGAGALDDLVETPGYLSTLLAVRGMSGRRACFEYPVAPSRPLLRWYVDHPERLHWPENAELSPGSARLRHALLNDDPPGSRIRAQDRARELVSSRSPTADEWWRFEGVATLDCMLITDRLVVTVKGQRTEPLAPATEWYPARSPLVRYLESAKHYAQGRQWASLLISDRELPEGSGEHLDRVLPESAPHLDAEARAELRAAYLGNLTWERACDAVGVAFDALPDSAG